MPHAPHLVLVDPVRMRRAVLRRRVTSFAVGLAIAAASAAPSALTAGR